MKSMMLGFALMVVFAAVSFAFPQEPEKLKCGYLSCGKNTKCGKTNGYDDCICLPGFYGSGYGDGCTAEPQCLNDTSCNDDEFCNDRNLCASSCMHKCPADVGCIARNHAVECLFTGELFFDPPTTNGSAADNNSGSTSAPDTARAAHVPTTPKKPSSSR